MAGFPTEKCRQGLSCVDVESFGSFECNKLGAGVAWSYGDTATLPKSVPMTEIMQFSAISRAATSKFGAESHIRA